MNIQSASTVLKHLYPESGIPDTQLYRDYADQWAWMAVGMTIRELAKKHSKSYEWMSRMKGMAHAWRRLKRGNAQDFKARYLYPAAGRV